MSYDARVFNVMIASPSDVASERSIVREVLYDWNAVHSERENIVLLPVGWESHSSPEMGARPQEIINKQTVDKCDLLVGIFGTRLGTDTGKYPSGTIEEIEDHIKSGKPAMVYFSNQLGDSGDFEAEQYTELMKWKEYYRSRGLCESYDSDVDFKDKFSRQLQIKVNQHEMFQFRGEEINASFEIEELDKNIPQLSDIAQIILKEVSQSSQGHIYVDWDLALMRVINDGANRKDLIPDDNPRVIAQWRAALKELKAAELLEDEGNAGQVFLITSHGYDIADMIEVAT